MLKKSYQQWGANCDKDVLLKPLEVSPRMAYNGLGIGEEGAFENRQSNIRTNVDSCTIVQLLPSAPFLPIPC